VLRFALWAAAGLLTVRIPGVVAVHNRLRFAVDDVSAACA